MLKLLEIIIPCATVFLLVYGLIHAADREAKNQCQVALQHCEQYADAGACEPRFLKICEGVEDDE